MCEKDPVASKGAISCTEVLERNVSTHITKIEDLLNFMNTNLQSVVLRIYTLLLGEL